jgi:outer membrane protein assembly factor BamB
MNHPDLCGLLELAPDTPAEELRRRIESLSRDESAWSELLARGAQIGFGKADLVELAAEVLSGQPSGRAARRRCPACDRTVPPDDLSSHCPTCQIRYVRCPACGTIAAPESENCANPHCQGGHPPLRGVWGTWTAFRAGAARTGTAGGPALAAAPDLTWSAQLGEPVLASPIVAGDIVYLAGKNGLMAAFDRDGRPFAPRADGLWPVRLPGAVAATPTWYRGRLFVATLEGAVFALDGFTGRIVAKIQNLGPIDASPAIHEDSGLIVVATQTGTVYGLDPDLDVQWRFPDRGDRPFGAAFRASPAIGDGALVLVTEAGETVALDIAGARVRERWRAWAPGEVLATPLIAKGFACLLTKAGIPVVYRLGDGRLHARGLGSGPSFVVASPALAVADHAVLVAGGGDGLIYGFDLLTGKPEPGFPIDPGFPAADPIVSSAACAAGLAIAGDDGGRLFAIDMASRRVAWHLALRAPLRSSPALSGDRLYVATEDGTLYGFRPA